MKLRYFDINNHRSNCCLRCLNYFGEMNSKLFDRITQRTYSPFKLYEKDKYRQRHYLCRVSLIFILIFILIIFSIKNLIQSFSTPKNTNVHLETYSIYKSRSLLINEELELNIQNHSIHHIYIDIGCFNGETIEHFIYFAPNSLIYDIITFEPDPINYYLCKNRLSQEKYKYLNIIIIPKVVWIRDEKVLYRTNQEQESRIDQRETKDESSSIELDGIDFSLWLSRLIKPNNTKLRIKISTPGVETKILEKMILDGTLALADKWDVQWTDRSNPRIRANRIYVQMMFDSEGFSAGYITRLSDMRRVFAMKRSYANVTKYSDWTTLAEYDTYAHYIQRPVVIDPPLTLKNKTKRKKF